jgi:hypothetical protein
MDNKDIEELKLIFIPRAECQATQEELNEKFSKNDIILTEIKTKLNAAIAILSAVGAAILGVAVKLLFQ